MRNPLGFLRRGMEYVEEAVQVLDEVLLEVVVLVDRNCRKSVGAQTNHNAFSGKARGLVRGAGVGDHDNPVRPYHASVVDAELVVLAPEAFNNEVDHDKVLDLWSSQLGLKRYHVEELVESCLACP